MYLALAPATSRTPIIMRDQHRRRPEVGLDDDQHGRDTDQDQPADEAGVVQTVVGAILCKERRRERAGP